MPDALIQFWQEHGRGAYEDGLYWFCDPALYQPVINEIFKFDPEYNPLEMTVVGHDAFGELLVWHRERFNVSVNLLDGTVFNPPEASRTDSDTGKRFTADFCAGVFLTGFLDADPPTDEDGEPIIPDAKARLGKLAVNEIYGFVPALMLGGQRLSANLQKFYAPEHMAYLASLEPLVLTTLTPPSPGLPFGELLPVRSIGQPSETP